MYYKKFMIQNVNSAFNLRSTFKNCRIFYQINKKISEISKNT